MFSSCLCVLPPGTLFSYQVPKVCMLGELVCLNCPRVNVSVSAPWIEGCLVQGWFVPFALSCLDGLQPPETLNRNKQFRK